MAILVTRKAHQPVFTGPKVLYQGYFKEVKNFNTSAMPVKYIYFSGVCFGFCGLF